MTQSADIVERLRSHAPSMGYGGCQDCYSLVMDDAADEIVRLREAKRRALQLADERAKEAAELRQALNAAATPQLPPVDEVARIMWECDHDGTWSDPHDGQDESKVIYSENASAALEFIRDWQSGHVAQAPAVPEGYVLVPRELTAENGAKSALIGEFSETFDYSDEDGDEAQAEIPVSWTTIKAIHKKMVSLFALAHPSTEQHSLPGHGETIDALSSLTIRPNGAGK